MSPVQLNYLLDGFQFMPYGGFMKDAYSNVVGLAAMCAAVGVDIGGLMPKKRTPNKLKSCLHCGDDHRHNNSFCSPSCCRIYRLSK